jgi:cytochrome c553
MIGYKTFEPIPHPGGNCFRYFLSTNMKIILILLAILLVSGPIAKAQDPITAGKASFDRVCGLCHGPNGRGDMGPALVPMTHELDEVLDIAREGRGMMPPVSPKTISDDEIANVVRFLKSLTDGTRSRVTSHPVEPRDVLQFGSRIERAAISGDMDALTKSSTDGSQLLDQIPQASEKKLVYYTEAYANYEFALQTSNQMESLKALADANRQIHEALTLDDKFSEGYILEAMVEAETLALDPKGINSAANVIATLERARSLDPKNPRLMLAQGITEFLLPHAGTDSEQAEKTLHQADEQFTAEPSDQPWPDWGHADALAWLGQVLRKKGDFRGAHQAYQRALALRPDFKWVNSVLLPALNQQ